jgi:hypothetical protein
MTFSLEQRVRETREISRGLKGLDTLARPLAHPSERLLIQLNAGWRVVDDDLQYILQRHKGNARKKATGWSGRSFCRTLEVLLRGIREYCGPVDDDALQKVRALPEWHVDR